MSSTRGRLAKKMTAAGQVFSTHGIVRGICFGKGVVGTLELRNGNAADAEPLVEFENLDYNNYVPMDITFGKGCYVTTSVPNPRITIFYE